MDFETLEPKTACTPGAEHFQLCKREQEKEYKDAKGEKHGNWMRYVNCACNNDEQNLVAFQHQGGILYRCCRPINPGQELLLSYKAELAEDLSVTSDCLNNKTCTDNELNAIQEVISCSFCQLSHTSQVDLDRHVKKCHYPEHEMLPKSEGIKHENPILSTNLVAIQHQGGILYRCCRPINPGQELLLSYKAELAEDLIVTSDCLHNKKCTDNELNGTWPVSCSFCQRSCTSQVDLDRHVKRCHSPEYEILPKSDEIEHENPILKSSSSRQCGTFQMPTNIKVHCCSVCGKRFTQKSHLQLHQHIHTGEKPYLCMQCGKNFTQQSSLQLHQRIHRGDKLYHCTQCGKNFSHMYYLQQHQRIHTGEKPYQCGKIFTHQSSLQWHQRIRTGEKP